MLVVFLVMIGLVIYLEHVYTQPTTPICNSSVCRAKAGHIMSYMNFDANPCEDFYDFACGSFSKVHNHPNQAPRYGSFSMADEYIFRKSKELLDETNEDEEPDFIVKLKTYYKACQNHDEDPDTIIAELLKRTELNHWPVLKHDSYLDDMIIEDKLAIVSCNEGVTAFFAIRRAKNGSLSQLRVYSGHTFARTEMFLNDTDELCIGEKKKYRDLMTYAIYHAGTTMGAIEDEVEELLRFETLFANVTVTTKKPNFTDMTLKELSEDCREIRWTDIFKYMYNYFGQGDEFYDEIPLTIDNKEYIDGLCKLFKQTRPRTIYNYLVWNFIAEYLRQYDPIFESSFHELNQHEDYQAKSKSKKCIDSFPIQSFQLSMNYLYIKRLQPSLDEIIEEAKGYEEEIRETLDHTFSVESWLDSTSRNITRERLANITGHIGYSPGYLDPEFVERRLRDINVTDNHIENQLLIEREAVKNMLLYNESDWEETNIDIWYPLGTSAYYMGDHFVLTLGILSPPFFEKGAPKYVNFPVIGFIIAHELGHAYDGLDIENERLNTSKPWPDEVAETFKEKAQCYVNQYSQFPLDDNGTMINGSFTLPDNLADNIGMSQAFMAYEKYIKANGEEPRLPGLDFTNEQMFFLSYAQSWCETVRNPAKVFEYDPHSPGRIRVLAPIQNSPRFSQVFKCPADSTMNPKNKCKLWG